MRDRSEERQLREQMLEIHMRSGGWRPAVVATVGVCFLPGFLNEETGS